MVENKRPEGAPTLKDVAALAEVSYRTVSDVVNGHRYIGAQIRTRVEAAIGKLGYRPQRAARQLRTGRSIMLTLSVSFSSQPYFARLAHAVVTEAEALGYDVLIDETRGVPERELRVASRLGTVLSDGILFSPLSIGLDQIVAAGSSTPLVLLGERAREGAFDSVVVDSVASSKEATQHLLDSGRKVPGFLGAVPPGVVGAPPGDLRLLGFNQALAEAGLAAKPEHILGIDRWDITGPDGLYTREAGHSRIVELLRSPQGLDDMDALICANDQLAVGALRALREAGIEVPNQMAVVGWDDIPEAAFTAPGLTTVSPDMNVIARSAIELMLRRCSDKDAEPRTVTAPYQLMLRGSG